MRVWFGIALLACMAAPLASSAQDREASWLRRPSSQEMVSVYPIAALKTGVDGQVTIRCTVSVEGVLKGCVPIKEIPSGLGFGSAAVALSTQFLMRPELKNGKPVEVKVDVPIHFTGRGIPTGSHRPGDDLVGQQLLLSRIPWAVTPTYAEVKAAYPAKAREKQVAGRATVKCKFKDEFNLGDCSIVNEAPSGFGFGNAAVKLAKQFQAPARPSGERSIKGAMTMLPITFPLGMVDGSSDNITAVDWLSRPPAQAFVASFPAKAREAGVGSSRVVLHCTVGPQGGLADCSVRSEDPAGYGFGEAALSVSRGFRLRKWTDDGIAMVGRPINIPIVYDNKTRESAAAAPPATGAGG